MSMRRRIIAIIAACLSLIIVGFTLFAVLEYVKIVEWVDVDGVTKYYAKNTSGKYELYAKGAEKPLPIDEQYKYYVTALGTLVSVDESTGEILKYIAVDNIERNEVIGHGDRVLLFKKIEKAEILSIEVYNEHGSFTICRLNDDLDVDKNGAFAIKSSPSTTFDLTLAEQLYSDTGYTLSTQKIKDPIKAEDGEYHEYGLAEEIREREVVDVDTGETVTEIYEYKPAYYIITDTSNNKHKIIIGDALVTGGGYYAQYVDISGETEVKRDCVYVLMSSVAETLLVDIETYVTPMVVYPMGMNNWYDVDKFVLGNNLNVGSSLPYDEKYDKTISFTYIDLEERKNTAQAVVPYQFDFALEGYRASDTAISNMLYKLYDPATVSTELFAPSEQDLVDYGFFIEERDDNGNVVKNEKGEIQYVVDSTYVISYYYDVLNDTNDGVEMTIYQQLFISDRDYKETGNYYTYSRVYTVETDKNGNKTNEFLPGYYDLIAEIDGSAFSFLKWTAYDWVHTYYFDQDLAYVSEIKMTGGEGSKYSAGYEAVFKADNSNSDQSGDMNTNNLFVTASQSPSGDSVETFGGMEIYAGGYVWKITAKTLGVYNAATGSEEDMQSGLAYYDHNALGIQVYCRSGYIGEKVNDYVTKIVVNGKEISGAAGAKVSVTANDVTIHFANGEKISYVRYSTTRYEQLYLTISYATLIDDYVLTPEEEAALIADESKLILTMQITIKDSKSETVDEYKFYRLSSRKAYITINGKGGFYVYTSRIEKFMTDAQKFFSGETIDATAKS